MYSPNKPIYVSKPSKGLLVGGGVVAAIGVISVYAVWLALSHPSSTFDIRVYVFPPLFIVIGAVMTVGYWRTPTIEFYDEFVRVVRRGAMNTDLHYSDVELGPLIMTRGGYLFQFSRKGAPRPRWRVMNRGLRDQNTTLYSLMQEKGTKGFNPGSAPAPFTPAQYRPSRFGRVPLLMAIAGAAITVLGIYLLTSGPIGLAVLFVGLFILLQSVTVRRILGRRGTDQ